MTSGLFVSDLNNKNCGGVHSFYDEKENQYGFLYPEITGYFISCLRFLNNQHNEEIFSQYAKYSSNWLIKIYEKFGAIIQGKGTRPYVSRVCLVQEGFGNDLEAWSILTQHEPTSSY